MQPHCEREPELLRPIRTHVLPKAKVASVVFHGRQKLRRFRSNVVERVAERVCELLLPLVHRPDSGVEERLVRFSIKVGVAYAFLSGPVAHELGSVGVVVAFPPPRRPRSLFLCRPVRELVVGPLVEEILLATFVRRVQSPAKNGEHVLDAFPHKVNDNTHVVLLAQLLFVGGNAHPLRFRETSGGAYTPLEPALHEALTNQVQRLQHVVFDCIYQTDYGRHNIHRTGQCAHRAGRRSTRPVSGSSL